MTDVVAVMTVEEARLTLAEIREALEAGLTQVERAQRAAIAMEQRGGYQALGYATMGDCLADELAVTRRRANQILQQARVSLLLSEMAGERVEVSARVAQRIDRAPEHLGKRVSREIEDGKSAREAVEAAVELVRRGPVPKPAGKRRSSGPPGLEGRIVRWRDDREKLFEELEADDATDYLAPDTRVRFEREATLQYEFWAGVCERLSRPPRSDSRIDD
ncbi:MAG: hypothetical protein NUW01_03710 [Gemmatimonadaceae bacterium]|nr:hypothetical protein [Gemmatimonadaceae bacterium]